MPHVSVRAGLITGTQDYGEMIALIDGDVVAHLACKSRWRNDHGQVVVLLDKKEKQFTKEEDRRYLEESYENFQNMLEELTEACWADDFLMAVKGPENYRKDLYPAYKMNRHKDPSKMNQFVPEIRKLAVFEGLAVEADGREADDYLRIWSEEARAAGDKYTIVSIDKDLACIPGRHYNIKTKTFSEVDEKQAVKFFYMQLLMGDPTDNIPGVPRLGPVKAKNFLVGLNTEEEMQELVVEQYMHAFDDEWYDYLLSNGKMLYLQKHLNDYFHLQDWPVVRTFRDRLVRRGVPLPDEVEDRRGGAGPAQVGPETGVGGPRAGCPSPPPGPAPSGPPAATPGQRGASGPGRRRVSPFLGQFTPPTNKKAVGVAN